MYLFDVKKFSREALCFGVAVVAAGVVAVAVAVVVVAAAVAVAVEVKVRGLRLGRVSNNIY